MDIELHCHSHYSKGTKLLTEGIPSPRDIVRTAKMLGLGGVALTDHRVATGWNEAEAEARKQGLLFIPGIEVSTQEGHVSGLGLTEFVPSGLSLEETVELIREQGGLAVANHPYDIKGDGVREGWEKADAVEVFNAINLDRLSNRKARLASRGFPRVVGSDAHTLEMLGAATNQMDADSVQGVLRAIRKGRVTHKARYVPVSVVREWAHQRFLGSHQDARERIATYSPLKRWVSQRLMQKYLRNSNGFFRPISHFGIYCSQWYGLLKTQRMKK